MKVPDQRRQKPATPAALLTSPLEILDWTQLGDMQEPQGLAQTVMRMMDASTAATPAHCRGASCSLRTAQARNTVAAG